MTTTESDFEALAYKRGSYSYSACHYGVCTDLARSFIVSECMENFMAFLMHLRSSTADSPALDSKVQHCHGTMTFEIAYTRKKI